MNQSGVVRYKYAQKVYAGMQKVYPGISTHIYSRSVFALFIVSMLGTVGIRAQNTAAVPANPGRQVGTVKVVSGRALTLVTVAAQEILVDVTDGAVVLQLAPGSVDLKAAQPITLNEIAVGDRVLVTGKPDEATHHIAASRVVLMKSSDIAQMQAAQRADWQKRGTGGLVSAVDAASGTISVLAGAQKLEVSTSPATRYRRYSGGSVKFEEARPGTLAEIRPGDQLRVRGTKSDDGKTVQAEEIVTGAFKNLSGTLTAVDTTAGTVTLRDIATKRTLTVKVSPNSEIRVLPEQVAARFAAQTRRTAGGQGTNGQGTNAAGTGGPGDNGARPRSESSVRGPGTAERPTHEAAGTTGPGGMGHGPNPGGGFDLSQAMGRLPVAGINDLKVGDAVMVVASESSDTATAVTILAGVGPILSATPTGAAPMTLSPWNVSAGETGDS